MTFYPRRHDIKIAYFFLKILMCLNVIMVFTSRFCYRTSLCLRKDLNINKGWPSNSRKSAYHIQLISKRFKRIEDLYDIKNILFCYLKKFISMKIKFHRLTRYVTWD